MKLVIMSVLLAVTLIGCGKREEPEMMNPPQEKVLSDGTICVIFRNDIHCNWKTK